MSITTYSYKKLERLLNESIQRQQANPFDSEISIKAREEADAIRTECQKRGYVFATCGSMYIIFKDVTEYEAVTNRKFAA